MGTGQVFSSGTWSGSVSLNGSVSGQWHSQRTQEVKNLATLWPQYQKPVLLVLALEKKAGQRLGSHLMQAEVPPSSGPMKQPFWSCPSLKLTETLPLLTSQSEFS